MRGGKADCHQQHGEVYEACAEPQQAVLGQERDEEVCPDDENEEARNRAGQGIKQKARLALHDAVGPERGEGKQKPTDPENGYDKAELVDPACDVSHTVWQDRAPFLCCYGLRQGLAALSGLFQKPFFFRKSSATAFAGSPPSCTRPFRSCKVVRSSFSKTGFRSSSIFGSFFRTSSRMIGAG